MNSPRSGFRRAAVASWALAGIGVAGVAGASQLAYAGTLKPAAEGMGAARGCSGRAAAGCRAGAGRTGTGASVPANTAPPAAAPAPAPQYTAPPVYTQTYVAPPAPVYVAPPAQTYVAPPAPVYVPPTCPRATGTGRSSAGAVAGAASRSGTATPVAAEGCPRATSSPRRTPPRAAPDPPAVIRR